MKQIISASRRTDLPAFYLDWLIDHLQQGSVMVANPFNPEQVSEVSLRKEDVAVIVLWSKDFGKFLQHTDEFAGYHLFFIFTINDNPVWEPKVGSLYKRLDQLRDLVAIYGSQCIEYRFDPIVFWYDGGALVNNLGSFEYILQRIDELGIDNCTINFANWYGKSVERALLHHLVHYDPSDAEKLKVTKRLAFYAKNLGIKLYSCCNTLLTTIPNVYRSHCIDGAQLQRLFGLSCSIAKHPTRSQCGCTTSKDIGNYNEQPCQHSCLYCYANPQV